ncbi:MAG TPA: hypothetical protein VLA19_05125 [Herpetosiphonaceae bacterium]|nr:hypothetical protein [Herpetosiphonaceae bacterium]
MLAEIEEYRRRYETNEFHENEGLYESWLERHPRFAAYWKWHHAQDQDDIARAIWDGDRHALNWYFREQFPKEPKAPTFWIDYRSPKTLNQESHPHLTQDGVAYETSAVLDFLPQFQISALRFSVIRQVSGRGWFGPKKAQYFVCAGLNVLDTSYSEMYTAHEAAQRLASNTAIDLLSGREIPETCTKLIGLDTSPPDYSIRYFPLRADEEITEDPTVLATIECIRPKWPIVTITAQEHLHQGQYFYPLRVSGWTEKDKIVRLCKSGGEAQLYGLAKAYDLAQAILVHATVSPMIDATEIEDPRYPGEARKLIQENLASIAST